MNTKNIVIFASGSGSNAENIAKYFKNSTCVKIKAIFCNKTDAYVLQRAKNMNIDSFLFNKEDFYNSEKVLNKLIEIKPDLIVLAGFLWLIPKNIINEFTNRIINIHPALLPKYGGKGMYGDNVHKADLENKESKTGITIHFVNEKYDDGDIIFQAETLIDDKDTPESIAERVHKLEYKFYTKIIEKLLNL